MTTTLRDLNLASVRRLCEDWPTMTREAYAECIAPQGIYYNVPRPAQRFIGPDAAFEALARWRDRCRIGLEVLHIQGDETVVFCERMERFENLADGRIIDLLVTGVFEMENGKIAAWRDYFEASQAPSAQFF